MKIECKDAFELTIDDVKKDRDDWRKKYIKCKELTLKEVFEEIERIAKENNKGDFTEGVILSLDQWEDLKKGLRE